MNLTNAKRNCQQAGLTIEAYFVKLMKLWDSLVCYRPPVSCTCGLCTCNVSAEIEQKREEDKVHDFSMGLDEEFFGMVGSNLLPTLEHVYLKVTQDEDARTKRKTQEDKSKNMAFVAHQVQRPRFRPDEREVSIVCSTMDKPDTEPKAVFKFCAFSSGGAIDHETELVVVEAVHHCREVHVVSVDQLTQT